MATSLRSSKLIENCTPSINYDRQVQAASGAFDAQMWEIIDDTGQVIMIPSIMDIQDETLVDILAWQFHVDFYDRSRDLTFRKNLVQMSIIWHKTKGTRALVQQVLDTYWPGGATLQEWFEYKSPFPPGKGAPALAGTFTPQQVSSGANTITFSGMVNGREVAFGLGAPNNTLADPLVANQIYYVVNATPTTFQVAETPNGAPLDFHNPGSGTNNIYVRNTEWHDRYRFRIFLNEDVIPNADDQQQVLRLIDRYKPVSRWLEAVMHPHSSGVLIYALAVAWWWIYRYSAAAIRRQLPPPL